METCILFISMMSMHDDEFNGIIKVQVFKYSFWTELSGCMGIFAVFMIK